jgi:hypothetical protein
MTICVMGHWGCCECMSNHRIGLRLVGAGVLAFMQSAFISASKIDLWSFHGAFTNTMYGGLWYIKVARQACGSFVGNGITPTPEVCELTEFMLTLPLKRHTTTHVQTTGGSCNPGLIKLQWIVIPSRDHYHIEHSRSNGTTR